MNHQRSLSVHLLAALAAFILVGAATSKSFAAFELRKGDRITIRGNTTAERLQNDGWFEAHIQARNPDKNLSIRNHGFSGDQLNMRLRVAGFGSEDDWLKKTEATVIFAFFGFNESFAGPNGVAAFEKAYDSRVKHWLGEKYDGENAPRIVLFSPVAHENIDNPKLPDGSKNNANLKLYTEAIKRVAEANKVTFVDLFNPTMKNMGGENRLTTNGIHLNAAGNKFIAGVTATALFGKGDHFAKNIKVDTLRDQIIEKDHLYFNNYQTTDGFNVHGGRSGKNYKGIDGVVYNNYAVMDIERNLLIQQAKNRDERIWALANGKDKEVKDDNLPKMVDVVTNKKGDKPDGSFTFKSGKEAVKTFEMADGLQANLFASEEMFPELINPVQMAFDTKGRLFVACWRTYPHWKPLEPMDDKIVILKDTNNDGVADKSVIFADGLHNPTGMEFWNGGLFVATAPHLMFLKDTDGDDKADVKIKVLHGLSSGDTHHSANSFCLYPGGGLYFGEGTFHRTQVETPHGPKYNVDGCMWRFEPRTLKLYRHTPTNFANPHGHVCDRWGNGYFHDGTGAVPYHSNLFSPHLPEPGRLKKAPTLYNRKWRPLPATEILVSEHFPDEMQGELLVQNVIGFQGMLRYRIKEKGSSYTAEMVEPHFLRSDELNFRPVDLEIAPDGSLYFTDWANPIIGHLQHHIRDPNRDQRHGRVYRVTHNTRPLMKPAKIYGEPIPALLKLLESDQDRVRYRTRIELSARDSSDVIAEAKKWMAGLDKSGVDYEHHILEGLWLHQSHDVVDAKLLEKVLNFKDHRARAAATHIIAYWHDRLPNALALVDKAVQDDHPNVRMEAVRSCSFMIDKPDEAMAVALKAFNKEQDNYMKYMLEITLKTLGDASKAKKK